jgi:hypothetical protein
VRGAKKIPFILLEVLLAISMLALFAGPLMNLPIRQYRDQVKRLERLDYQRIADLTFLEVKEKLLKEEIEWKKLPPKNESITITLPNFFTAIPGLTRRTVHRSAELNCAGEKEGYHGEIFRIYHITVRLNKDHFTYRLIVQRL